jgi:mRNA interferase RelE/StbE
MMSNWQIIFSKKAQKQFDKLDQQTRKQIRDFLRIKLLPSGDPRSSGKALSANLSRYWRYRVGKYRLICEIRDGELVVEVITVGKRDSIYESA